MTLYAFAAKRRAGALLLLSAHAVSTRRRRPQLSIGISYPQGAAAANPAATTAAVDRRDRQTDGHPTVL